MKVVTEKVPPALEMFIHDNASGAVVQNESLPLLGNDSNYMIEESEEINPDPRRGIYISFQTARGVCLVIFIVIGIIFNSFMIISIVPNRRLRTVRNILLVHLGCTGLIVSVIINLITAVISFTGSWFGGIILCQIYGYLLSVLTLVIPWTIAALSWDKYQTIACPLRHSLTTTAVKMFVCFTVFWTVACTLSIPPLLGGSRFVFHTEKGICFVRTSTITGKVYIAFYLLASVYFPLGLMLYCYTHIYRIARTQSSRIAATMVRMTCLIQAPITANSSSNSTLSVKGTKAMCTIFQLVGAFVIVYVPISVIFIIEIMLDVRVNVGVSTVVSILFFSAPVVHSCVYGLRNKILRVSFQRYLRRKIRYYCYKDKRKNSVKSFRSASFKAAMLNRRANIQNGGGQSLRRTQSFPSRVLRPSRNGNSELSPNQNGRPSLLVRSDSLTRPHSFNVLTSAVVRSPSPVEEGNEDDLPDDIPHIDDDDIAVC